MNSRSFIVLLHITLYLFLLISLTACAAEDKVKASIPDFKISLNGIEIENHYRQYPLLIYKNMTYFPMTYHDSRFLGLETAWSLEDGFRVAHVGVNREYKEQRQASPNEISTQASIAQLPVKVNGEDVNTGNERYPLLQFRDVVYFPLTSRFAVDAFQWEYTWDVDEGLSIQTPGVIKIEEVVLPIAQREYGWGEFINAEEYYYYETADGWIAQATADKPDEAQKVYKLPLNADYMGAGVVNPHLSLINGEVRLRYQIGSAAMGSMVQIWLKSDGSWEELKIGSYDYYVYDDLSLQIANTFLHGPNNLWIKTAEKTEYRLIGDPNYYYSLSLSSDLYRFGNEIYLLGTTEPGSYESTNLFRINLQTGDTVQLCDYVIAGFLIDGGNIYFLDNEQRLYVMPISGGDPELLSSGIISFSVLDNQVFYVKNGKLFLLGQSESLHPDGECALFGAYNGYLHLRLSPYSDSTYRYMIFDSSGHPVAKTIEEAVSYTMETDKILMVKVQE